MFLFLGDTKREGETLYPPFDPEPFIIGFLTKFILLGDTEVLFGKTFYLFAGKY